MIGGFMGCFQGSKTMLFKLRSLGFRILFLELVSILVLLSSCGPKNGMRVKSDLATTSAQSQGEDSKSNKEETNSQTPSDSSNLPPSDSQVSETLPPTEATYVVDSDSNENSSEESSGSDSQAGGQNPPFLPGALDSEEVVTEGGEENPPENPPRDPQQQRFRIPLAWEKARPESKKWSEFVYMLLEKEIFVSYNKAKDASYFCARYPDLNRGQKIAFWAYLISTITYYESAYNPKSRMREGPLGRDAVTGKPVYSEGLLQLSYQDTKWYPYCKMDWNKDRHLDDKDDRKTIFDPYINLDCGMRIFAQQINRKNKIAINSGAYWAVIKPDSKYNKIAQIKKATNALPFCGD